MTRQTWLQAFKNWRKPGLESLTSERGAQMEARARRHLEGQGLSFVSANYRCKGGEIDLIMRDQQQLVFVEVRYRQQSGYGSAAESVDNRKQKKLRHAAQHYLQQHQEHGSCRFDVIAIDGPVDKADLNWIANAF